MTFIPLTLAPQTLIIELYDSPLLYIEFTFDQSSFFTLTLPSNNQRWYVNLYRHLLFFFGSSHSFKQLTCYQTHPIKKPPLSNNQHGKPLVQARVRPHPSH
jgi:hypothetical protein